MPGRHEAQDRPGPGRARLPVVVVFGALLLAHVSFLNEFERFRQPNAFSRLYLTLALAEQGRFVVDEQVARYGTIQDLAQYQGHYYSDKPPGSSMLMAPVALLLRHTFLPVSADPMAMAVALRLLCVSLPALLFWYLTRSAWFELAGGVERGLAVILAGGLGSIFFIYATELFSHVQAAILCFAGYLAIRNAARLPPGDDHPVRLRIAASGLCLGLALITDFILALAVPVLAYYALACRRGDRGGRLLALLAGALLPALLLGGYNAACFGSPFGLGSHHLVDPDYRAGYARGLFGIQRPDLRGLAEITLLPRRGIAYLSPVLLLAPLGFWREWRDPARRAEAAAALGAAAAILLFAITTVDWTGGWSAGCRYLVPAIPFLLVGVAAFVRDAPASGAASVLFRGFTCVGLVTIGLTAASFPHYPPEFGSPVWQLAVPLLLSGHVMPGLVGGSDALRTLLPFAVSILVSMAFVLARSWPRAERQATASALAAGGLAATVLLAMALTAPTAASELHQRGIGLILHIMGS